MPKVQIDIYNKIHGERGADDYEKSLKSIEERAKKAGKAMTIAGGVIVGALGAMVKKASDAQETTAKFGTVFESVFTKAGTSVDELTQNYGLSSLAAKTMLSATGDLLTGLGMGADVALELSDQTQKLAVDLASFTNFAGGAEGASDALTKAMLGERESVKALGIVITEELVKEQLLRDGKEKLTGMALKQAKAEATLKIAVMQSKNAMGDYARTSDGLANKSRELGARLEDLMVEIGTKLIPVVTDLASKATEVINKIMDWTRENPGLTDTIVKVVAAAGVLLLTLGPIVIILPKIVAGLVLVKGALVALVGPIGAVTAAAVAAYAVVNKLIQSKNDLVDADYRAFEAEHKLGQKLREAADAAGMSRKEFVALSRAYDGNVAALAMAIKKGKEGKELQEALAVVGKKHKEAIDEQRKAYDGLAPAVNTANTSFEKSGRVIKHLTGLTYEQVKSMEEWKTHLDVIWRGFDDLEMAVEDTDISFDNLYGTVEDTNQSVYELVGVWVPGMKEIEEKTVETVDIMETRWGDLISNIGTSFGNFVDSLLDETTTWKQVTEGLWDDLKTSFRSVIADMVKDWVTGFLAKLVTKTEGVSGLLASAIGGAAGGGGAGGGGIGGLIGAGVGSTPWGAIATGVGAMLGGIIGGNKTKGAIDATNRALEQIWFNTQNLENATLHNIVPILDDIKKTGWSLYDLMSKDGDKSAVVSGKGGMSALNIKAELRNRILRDIREAVRHGGVGGPGRKKAPKVPGEPVTPPGEPDPQGFQGSMKPWLIQDTGQKAGDQITIMINAVDAKSFDRYLRNEGEQPVISFVKRNKTRINNALAGNR